MISSARLLSNIQPYITEYGNSHSSLNLCKTQERIFTIMVVLIAELSFESHHSSHRTTRPRDKGVTRHLQDYLGISGANGGLPLIYCSD